MSRSAGRSSRGARSRRGPRPRRATASASNRSTDDGLGPATARRGRGPLGTGPRHVTSCPAATSARTAGRPTTPVAPVTNTVHAIARPGHRDLLAATRCPLERRAWTARYITPSRRGRRRSTRGELGPPRRVGPVHDAWIPHGTRYSRAGRPVGPARRISVHRNAGSSPSIASTTSSTRDLVGGPRRGGTRHAGPGTDSRIPAADQRLEVLGEVGRRARRGTRRAARRAAPAPGAAPPAGSRAPPTRRLRRAS